MRERETVPCELCERPTPMLGTRRCHRCYELETRIKDDPALARKILADLAFETLREILHRNSPGVHGPSASMRSRMQDDADALDDANEPWGGGGE